MLIYKRFFRLNLHNISYLILHKVSFLPFYTLLSHLSNKITTIIFNVVILHTLLYIKLYSQNILLFFYNILYFFIFKVIIKISYYFTRGVSYMKIETEKLKKLGKTLKELRIQNNLSFREVDKLTGVDISTISRLEEAKGHRINTLILNKLAKVYNVNPVSLLMIIDYVKENDIKQYLDITESEASSINNNEIEILNENNSSYYPKRFMKLPDITRCKAVKINNRIFLYDDSCPDNNDLGLFRINDKITVAFYYFLDDTVTFKDFFTDFIFMRKKDSFSIIGKIKSIVDISLM